MLASSLLGSRVRSLLALSILGTLAACAAPVAEASDGPDPDDEEDAEIDSVSSEIRGGHAASSTELPAVGIIIWSGKLFCNATVVAPRIVMTSAACLVYAKRLGLRSLPDGFYNGPGRSLTAVPTLANMSSFGGRWTVDKRYIHPSYSPDTHRNNWALLRLTKSINVTPLKLATSAPTSSTSRNCWTAGYGADAEIGPYKFLRKRVANVGVNDWTSKAGTIQVNPRWPFTDASSGDAAINDSGAPLYCSGRIQGIHAFQYPIAYTGNFKPPPHLPNDRVDFDYYTPVRQSWVANIANSWNVSRPAP